MSTAAALLQCNGLDYCLSLLKGLLEHWKNASPDEVRKGLEENRRGGC